MIFTLNSSGFNCPDKMPLIYESSYTQRPFPLYNSYLETLYPYFTTKVGLVIYVRERLELPDGDFLDLDWIENKSTNLILISHGFEGNSKDHFIEKSADFLSQNDYDILVWHYRSCGGKINRLPRFYHHGDIGDLDQVIRHAVQKNNYQKIILLGFSMGGDVIINYLGSDDVHPSIKGGLAFSAPLDLRGASQKLSKGFNRHLEKSFFKKLIKKVEKKSALFPNVIKKEDLDAIKNLRELNQKILLPLNGFKSLDDYFNRWSSFQFITKIKVPFLLVNAKNDPILTEKSFPLKECEKSGYVHLETPKFGGHTGFTKRINGELWYVQRVLSFVENFL